jgi:tol-pal system protein YbgF
MALAQQSPSGGPRPVKAPSAKEAPSASVDAGLLKRIEDLEGQIVDMQVLVGTLESLAKGAPPPSPGPKSTSSATSVGDSGRLDALETQVQALAAQMEGLQEQLRSLADRPPSKSTGEGFGAVTVAPAGGPKDDLDRVFPTAPPKAKGLDKSSLSGSAADAETPPQQLYERAYSFLLTKDYATAETTFESFLKQHPTHPLAGNAQFWLGETFYVRHQYRPAAAAFLKGYQDYAKSQKAPESLLKLAMSLQRLGQKDAACSSFTEFASKYPSPPDRIRSLADAERKRSGC